MDRTLQDILKTLESQVRDLPLATLEGALATLEGAAATLEGAAATLEGAAATLEGPNRGGASLATGRSTKTLSTLVHDAEQNTSDSHNRVSNALASALAQARAMVTAPACPIVAILGMLNAGKSSLVASYLGSHGTPRSANSTNPRSRVLIGSANSQGTHRFVLWLPHAWKETPEVWAFVEQQLQSVFGTQCESLSDDPEQAATQYNDLTLRTQIDAHGRHTTRCPIEIPLVATDPNLDRLGIALMDCPDVQTGLLQRSVELTPRHARYDEASASAAESRFEVLSRAATICSAFVVVLPANALHDQTVSKLLRLLESRMPHVQRMLAVNRVPRRYRIDEIARDVNHLYRGSNLRRVYMAYNFDGPLARERLPKPPIDFRVSTDPPLPLFFRIDGETSVQPPDPIPDEDWLIRLGSQLQANALLEDAIRSANAHLTTTVHRSIALARSHVENQHQQTAYCHQLIADACTEFSLDPGSSSSHQKIRLQASRQVIQQIADSLERTAPWWARPGRWVQRIAHAGKSTVTGAVSWFRMPGWVSDGGNAIGDWVRARFKRGEAGRVVTADTLCDSLARRDRRGLLAMDESETHREAVRQACQRAIERFQNESVTKIDPEQVDALTRRVWSEMPVRQRLISGVAPAGILFAPLLAVIMVPLDFGGTSVLVFASLKELLFAGAAGVGLVLASSDAMPHLAESESAWQQLSDLIAVVTDAMGLDRASEQSPTRVSIGNTDREIAPSPIPPERSLHPEVPGSRLAPWNIDEARIDAIVKSLDAMEQAQKS